MNGYVPWTNFNNTLARLGQYAGFKQRQRQQEAENKRADAYLNLAQIREERDKQRYDDEQAMLPYRYMQVKYDALQKILPSVTKENYRQIYPWLVQDNIQGRGGLPTFSVPSIEQVEDPSFNFDEWKNKFGLTAEQRANMEVKSLERDLERDKLAFGREELANRRKIADIELQKASLKSTEKQNLSTLGKEFREFQETHPEFTGGQEDYTAIMKEAEFNPYKAAMDLATKSTIAQFQPEKVPELADNIMKWWARKGMNKAYGIYKSADEVKADYDSGLITKEVAADILRKKFDFE